jgi:hypothetical protein
MLGGDRLLSVRQLEGRSVNVALIDGSRIDDCQLVSAGRSDVPALWLYPGRDLFVPYDHVIDIWESGQTDSTAISRSG